MPTGLGKTVIALMLIEYFKQKYPDKKILFLAPTKPLVNQHVEFLRKYSDIDPTKIVGISGDIPKEKRVKLYNADVIVATPQTIKNDLANNLIDLNKFSLIIFDEAHRAVGNYSYTYIARNFNNRIVGLTASPGSDEEKIKEIIENLKIERIEYRNEDSSDVRPYVKKKVIKYIGVALDKEILTASSLIQEAIEIRKKKLEELGILKRKIKDIALLMEELKKKQAYSLDERVKDAIIIGSEILILFHALKTLQTQTYRAFLKFCESLFENAQKLSEKNVAEDVRLKKAYLYVKDLVKQGKEHPKINALLEIIKKNKDKKIIVFAQLTDTVMQITELLNKNNIKAVAFTGKKLMTQKKQIETLDKFRANIYNVLVASSVAEEGLDIPKVDLVIFYEPIPSAIRAIQRKGRTGRLNYGEVIILYSKNTLDEKALWASIRKEKKMYEILEKLSKEVKPKKEQTLNEVLGFRYKIIADQREQNSLVVDALKKLGIGVKIENLEVGDYIVGDVVIERKTIRDFVDSIIDNRIWDQMNKLSQLDKKLLILEGEEDPYFIRDVNPNVIRSVILTLSLKGIPIIRTKNPIDTAYYIKVLSEKQNKLPQIPKIKKKELTPKEVLASFPGIGEKSAEELLKRYKTIKNVVNASLSGLSIILGEKRAKKLKEFLEKEYQ